MQLLLLWYKHRLIIVIYVYQLLHQCYNILVWKYLTKPANAESTVQYQISGTLEIPDTRYPIFLKTIWYEPDTDTDTDIITALVFCLTCTKQYFCSLYITWGFCKIMDCDIFLSFAENMIFLPIKHICGQP